VVGKAQRSLASVDDHAGGWMEGLTAEEVGERSCAVEHRWTGEVEDGRSLPEQRAQWCCERC